jgi:hypothetical protein
VPAQLCVDRRADDSHKPKYDNQFAENFHAMSCAKDQGSLASLYDNDNDNDNDSDSDHDAIWSIEHRYFTRFSRR